MTDKEKRDLHTQTINNHISIVRDLCNKMGIPELGKQHDLSKFSPEEFEIYKWADGKRSPHDNARDELGYSPSWYLHAHNNPHHWEYFVGFNSARKLPDGRWSVNLECIKMPYERVIEMLCDFIAAGQVYNKDKWTTLTPWDYWKTKCEGDRAMHPVSEYLIKKLLFTLSEMSSLDEFIKWYSNAATVLKRLYNNDEVDY